MKSFFIFMILLASIGTVGAADYPTDGDNWTETYTTGWALYSGTSTISLNSSDKQVGTNSVQIVSNSTSAFAMTYDCANVNLSDYTALIFWLKVNKTIAWRTTYSVYLDEAGTNRWTLSGNLPTTWTKYTLYKSDMSNGNFNSVEWLHWDWDGEGHPITLYIDGVHFETGSSSAPSITSYAPTATIWPEVQDSQRFNVTTNQTTRAYWYVNGTLKQTNSTLSTTHAYTNTSLFGGGCNVTAFINNSQGNDTQTWIFEVGAESIDYIILKDQPANMTLISEWNVIRIGSNVTDWGIWQNYTFNTWNYYFRFANDTEIMNQTATSDNESLWFNDTALLPVGVYYLNATSDINNIVLGAHQHGLLRKNTTSAETFSQIAAGIDHDQCYTWWNSTADRWESYRVGYSYNAGTSVPEHDSYFVLMDSTGTTIECNKADAETIAISEGYYTTYLRESTNKTLSAIKTDMGGNVDDLWAFNPTTGAWTDTGAYSVQPNQGLMVNSSTGFDWDGTVP